MRRSPEMFQKSHPNLSSPTTSKPFETRDIYLAAYLFHLGERLTGTRRENGKAVFIFEAPADLEAKANGFYRPDCEARRLFDAYRTVKQIAFDR